MRGTLQGVLAALALVLLLAASAPAAWERLADDAAPVVTPAGGTIALPELRVIGDAVRAVYNAGPPGADPVLIWAQYSPGRWDGLGVALSSRTATSLDHTGFEGRSLVAWTEIDNGGVEQVRVRLVSFDGVDAPGGGGSLNVDPARRAFDVTAAVVGGVPHVGWVEIGGGTAIVHVKRLDAATGTWVAVGGPVDAAPFNALPDLAEVDGRPTITWVRRVEGSAPTSFELPVRRFDGTSWASYGGRADAPATGDFGDATLVSAASGLHAVWRRNGDVLLSTYDPEAGTWSRLPADGIGFPQGAATRLAADATSAPTVAGRRVVVARTVTTSSGREVRVARLRADGSRLEEVVGGELPLSTSAGATSAAPSVSSDGTGVPFVGWTESTADGTRLRASRLRAELGTPEAETTARTATLRVPVRTFGFPLLTSFRLGADSPSAAVGQDTVEGTAGGAAATATATATDLQPDRAYVWRASLGGPLTEVATPDQRLRTAAAPAATATTTTTTTTTTATTATTGTSTAATTTATATTPGAVTDPTTPTSPTATTPAGVPTTPTPTTPPPPVAGPVAPVPTTPTGTTTTGGVRTTAQTPPATTDPVTPTPTTPATAVPGVPAAAVPPPPPPPAAEPENPRRSSVSAALRRPGELPLSVADLVRSFGIGLLLVALLGFPALLFNMTITANRDEIRGWFGPLGRGIGSLGLTRAQRLLAVAATSVVVGTGVAVFLDPKFPGPGAAPFVGGVLLALTVLVGSANLALRLCARRFALGPGAWGWRVYPGQITLSAICVLVSRLAGFVPGLVLGLSGDYECRKALTSEQAGRKVVVVSLTFATLSVLAWLTSAPVAEAAERPTASWAVLMADTTLTMLTVAGLETLVFMLVPLVFLDGHVLLQAKPVTWALLWGAGLLWFCVLVVNPALAHSGDDEVDLAWVVALFSGLMLVSVSLWAYFALRTSKQALQRAS